MMRVVVIGTGTGIGKTHLGSAVLRAAVARGWPSAGRKPVESGVVPGAVTDAHLLEASGDVRPDTPPPYVFADGVSPHLAARREGRIVDVEAAAAWSIASSGGARLVVVETAGGLLSPLGRDVTNLDLTLAVHPDAVLLVAADRLGVLHEVGSARRILPPELWERTVVALVAPEVPDASTGCNAAELAWLGWVEEPCTWPRGARDASKVLDALVAAAAPRAT